MKNRALLSFNSRIGKFTGDRRALIALLALALIVAGRSWLADHPQHNPWAPLDLRDPQGLFTSSKLAALREDPALCREVLARSEVPFTSLPEVGEGECRRADRATLDDFPLSPSYPPTTCSIAVALELWRLDLEQGAKQAFGTGIAAIDHLGAYSCRRKYGRSSGDWSEHATGNAIDIAAFTLADGREISVLRDWPDAGAKGQFLRHARDLACARFGITLSPEYNRAHRDHLHLDMGGRPGSFCR